MPGLESQVTWYKGDEVLNVDVVVGDTPGEPGDAVQVSK